MAKIAVRKKCLLEKFPGKGGWTFARVPEIAPDKRAPFGWVKVKGCIDSFELKGYRLMPMGDGTLFLPVRSEIRKRIGKRAGDHVLIELSVDQDPLEIPEELRLCLADAPAAQRAFFQCSEAVRQAHIHWIYSARNEDTRVERIVKMINDLGN